MATRSLDQRVAALEETVAGLQQLPNQVALLQRDFAAFQHDVRIRFEQIDARFEQVDARFDRVEQLVRDENERMYSRMRMLNEDLITRIKTIDEGGDAPPAGQQKRPRKPRP